MKPFTKHELLGLSVIFAVLIIMAVPNFVKSIQRARDVTRKEDLGRVTNMLGSFLGSYKKFPESTPDGKIIACFKDGIEVDVDPNKDGKLDVDFVPCEWSGKSFIGMLPGDPHGNRGVSYRYVSNGRRYQLFASLEAHDDDEYRENIEVRNLMCGTRACNAGRGYSNTPLDKTLEEYEDELYEQSLKK